MNEWVHSITLGGRLVTSPTEKLLFAIAQGRKHDTNTRLQQISLRMAVYPHFAISGESDLPSKVMTKTKKATYMITQACAADTKLVQDRNHLLAFQHSGKRRRVEGVATEED